MLAASPPTSCIGILSLIGLGSWVTIPIIVVFLVVAWILGDVDTVDTVVGTVDVDGIGWHSKPNTVESCWQVVDWVENVQSARLLS